MHQMHVTWGWVGTFLKSCAGSNQVCEIKTVFETQDGKHCSMWIDE